MKHIKGCAIEQFEALSNAVLIHQVNCQGVMGSGIAKSIRAKYPQHYEDYITGGKYLGDIVRTEVSSNKHICGVFGQKYYGANKVRYTNYLALMSGIDIAIHGHYYHEHIITPKFIGCGLGGGDWNIVEMLLLDLEQMYDVEFTVCEK